VSFCRQYFEELLKEGGYFNAPTRDKVEFTTKEFYLSHQLEFKEQYKMGETIGNGGLSTSRKCYHRLTGEVRAVKVTKKKDLEMGERPKLLQQIEILKELDHPSICRVIDIFEDSKKFYFVTEYLSGGGLFNSLITNVGFTEHASATILKQILSAVAYLHGKNIAHRNIHPDNVLFQSNDALNVKVLDFGSSRKMGENEPLHGVYGTAYYVAPECLHGDYDLKCDTWSVGILMYMLLSGKPPFNGTSDR
jgi:calcium-dependent protein kinase